MSKSIRTSGYKKKRNKNRVINYDDGNKFSEKSEILNVIRNKENVKIRVRAISRWNLLFLFSIVIQQELCWHATVAEGFSTASLGHQDGTGGESSLRMAPLKGDLETGLYRRIPENADQKLRKISSLVMMGADGHSFSSSNDNNKNVAIKSHHVGPNSYQRTESHGRKFRSIHQENNIESKSPSPGGKVVNIDVDVEKLGIEGIRIEDSPKEPEQNDGVPSIYAGTEVLLRVFGFGLTEHTVIAFTKKSNIYGGECQYPSTESFPVLNDSLTMNGKTALFKIELPPGTAEYYICAKNDDISIRHNVSLVKPLVHQGSERWLRLSSHEPLLPLWASLIIIFVCLIFSALFSGLNLGLMALDRTELKILRNTGTEKERKYASDIQPVRDHGNYLLCSILLGNVLVNSTFTILLDGLTSGLIAVVFSTIAIVLFGEITPQAICSRHGLAVGAKTIYITKAVMIITFPLSYPISKILDCLLGEEIGNVYNRERLKELVRVTTGINDLDKNEVNIISGALELRKKMVSDVMTHIEDAYMLPLDAILDFETVSEIMKSGFSRIPVYDGDRKNIVTLLYIKDLAFVDPDDNTPLKTLCEFYQNPCHFVFEDVTLDIMFNQFKEGHKGHMAFVHRVNNEGDGDPFYETIGLVTLEDVIEELIQAEIIDETDVFTDNRTKVRRQKVKNQDFTIFAEKRETHRIRISPQLTLATFQYLSTTVDAFKPDMVSETILRRLLNQDIVHQIRCKGKEKDDPEIYIYQQGKPVDFFVLILEGRVEVTVGRENLVFESGPFTFFGTQALMSNVGVVESPNSQQQVMGSLQSLHMDAMLRHTFVPDYSVRAISDVLYITIRRNLYLAAKRATLLEKSKKVGGGGEISETIDDEVEKLLHSLDEDDRSMNAVQSANLDEMNNIPSKNQSKRGSNTPSPTIRSINNDSTANSSKRGSRDHQAHNVLVYGKEMIAPNGPNPTSPNSITSTATFLSSQQHPSLGEAQLSNSLNYLSSVKQQPHQQHDQQHQVKDALLSSQDNKNPAALTKEAVQNAIYTMNELKESNPEEPLLPPQQGPQLQPKS